MFDAFASGSPISAIFLILQAASNLNSEHPGLPTRAFFRLDSHHELAVFYAALT